MAEGLEFFLGEYVHDKDGSKVAVKSFSELEVVGLYCAGSWCDPCHKFTPVLEGCYEKLKAAGKKFEVILVSFDFTEEACMKFYEGMPWLILPFVERMKKSFIKVNFFVEDIPTLLFLNPKTGDLIRHDGRKVVQEDPEGKDFPWDTCKV